MSTAFALLRKRRFAPFFLTQGLGALNDNIFKNAVVILIAFSGVSEAQSGLLINLAAGLFILPFFLCSPVAGQIADLHDKARLMRLVKWAEVAIMAVGATGFYLHSTPVLFCALFLMGVHSAFFGPVKYSILPQQLREDELVTGNALVEMGTFLAILLGTLIGGVLAQSRQELWLSAGVLATAALGVLSSRFIPAAPPVASEGALAGESRLNFNPFTQSVVLTRMLRSQDSVFGAVMAISWYWYVGAVVLAQLPTQTRHVLGGDESVVTLLLATFAISISLGALLCAKLSKGQLRLGLVPLGMLGLSLFLADFGLSTWGHSVEGSAPLRNLGEFFSGPQQLLHLRVVADVGLTGVFSSLFIVPLYTLLQKRSLPHLCSRVIAANNIYNSIFMVASALLTMVLYQVGFSTPAVLLLTAGLNLLACLGLCLSHSEYLAELRGRMGRPKAT